MQFKIHRGSKEIGGSCVEIWTEMTRLVVDFGLPLVNSDKTHFEAKGLSEMTTQQLIDTGTLPDIQGLYNTETKTILLLSHAHQDHYGLINYVHDDCQVYLGEATHKLIKLTNIFTNRKWEILHPHYFKSGVSFYIGDIEIIPYLMDHSAFDAYSFMIKADGKSLFYSGDFRIHGRKKKAFDWFSYNVDKEIDYLLMEGTTIGRTEKSFLSEQEIEMEFVKTFEQTNGINLIYTSGQNIDRLVSIYKACIRTSKTFAIDFYTANILKEIASFGYKIPFPSKDFPDIKVFFPYRLSRMITNQGNEKLMYRFKNFKITREEIDKDFENIVMVVRPTMLDDILKLKALDGGTIIYSMWSGYKKEKATKEFIEMLINRGMTAKDIHTSGHADLMGLKRMVSVLKPKNLVPIHTFESDKYSKLFSDTNVLIIEDKQIVRV